MREMSTALRRQVEMWRVYRQTAGSATSETGEAGGMSRTGYLGRRKRIDKNQQEIAEALRAAGCGVCILSGAGDGIPDLLCANFDRTWLVEVKAKDGNLTADQVRFSSSWPGEIQLVRTVEDALSTIRKRK